MPYIQLTRGLQTLVDTDRVVYLQGWNWHATKSKHCFYAATHEAGQNRTLILMHRLLMDAKKGELVQHVNGDSLDNRMGNLRIARSCEIQAGTAPREGTKSGYKGVTWLRNCRKWRAQICIDSRMKAIGAFDDVQMAAAVYNEMAYRRYGDLARLNFIPREKGILAKEWVDEWITKTGGFGDGEIGEMVRSESACDRDDGIDIR